MGHIYVFISQDLFRNFLKGCFAQSAKFLIEHVHLSRDFISGELTFHIFEFIVELVQ